MLGHGSEYIKMLSIVAIGVGSVGDVNFEFAPTNNHSIPNSSFSIVPVPTVTGELPLCIVCSGSL